ncbi:MAG: hypothetical protein AAFR21_01870 [Pseudomonadota bacterium]
MSKNTDKPIPQDPKTSTAEPAPKLQMHEARIVWSSVLALCISVAALLVSLLEVSSLRATQRASTWPYLTIQTGFGADGFSIEATNKGVGPAKMGDVNWASQGVAYTDMDQLIIDTIGEEDAFSYDVYKTNNPSQDVVAAGETVTLFNAPWEDRVRRLSQSWVEDLSIESCYCSIYDECWSVSLNQAPTAKNTCKTP